MARPTKCTRKLIEKAKKAALTDAPYEIIAFYLGISPATFYRWKDKGEADIEAGKRSVHREFWETVRECLGEAAVGRLARIERAGRGGDARLDLEFLSRRYPHLFGRQVHEHTGKVDTSPQGLSLDEAAGLTDDPAEFKRRYYAEVRRKHADRLPPELDA